MSHLNAQPNPTPIYVKGGSKFLRSKHFGELAVRDAFPDATVFRPSDIFGLEDRFIRYYASGWRRSLGTIPLWKRGSKTVKNPVFCFNVAEGIINSLKEPSSLGATYECVGPHSYYLSDLVDYFYRCLRHPSLMRTYVTPLYKMKVTFMSFAPSTPILTMDKLDREHVSDVQQDLMTLEDLGVTLTKLEDQAPYVLKPFRRYNYLDESVGEFAAPEPPPFIVT
jgi:NADH dehydrogenase (ubiquinone) 1 alpha subcomplex subunit 9